MADTTGVKYMARRPAWHTHLLHSFEESRLFSTTLLVPVLIFFIVWNIIPLLWMLGLSFYNYSMVTGVPEKFIGFGNYLDIYNNFSVWNGFGRTFKWVFVTVGVETVLGVLLGLLFWGSSDLPGRRVALTMIFTPMILAPASTSTFFRLIYDPTFGVINYFVHSIFGMNIDFLGDRAWAFGAVALVDIWMWTPFMILITLAALGAVPRAELEAAEVDRLPWYKRFSHVILPRGKFILMLGILLRTIDSFKVMDLIYIMTKGGPGNMTETIAISLWRKAFEGFTMGWSSALAVILLLIAIAFTSVYLYVLNLRKRGEA
jgi:multiple sugar transport system permease protein